MLKKCSCLLLPTNQKANHKLWYSKDTDKLWYDDHGKVSYRYEPYELYVLSDDKIEEGDYCIDDNGVFGPYKKNDIPINQFKKIIATTDTNLTIEYDGIVFKLAQPSQSFIQRFIESYNSGKPITNVMVEYEEYDHDEEWSDISGAYETYKERVKVSKDNTISIKRIKSEWNRDEVTRLITMAYHNGYGDRDKDIGPESNLPYSLEQMD